MTDLTKQKCEACTIDAPLVDKKRFTELLDIKINCGLNKQSKAKVKLNIKDEKKQNIETFPEKKEKS